jgi:branched-chain amino acid transport system permease protein
MLLRLVFLGISLGAFYALVALGFSLVFGVTRIFNLAHGEMVLLGAYAAYWVVSSDLSFALAFPLSVILLVLAGALVAWLGLRIKEPYVLNSLLVTLGLAMILQSLYQSVFGGDYHLINLPYLSRGINLGLFWASGERLAVMLLSAVLLMATHRFMSRSDTGREIRATIQDREAALLSGINTRKMTFLANLLGAALIALAGPLFASVHYIYPQAGMQITLLAILIAILVGVGRTGAVILGGIVLGLMETFSVYYLSGEWQETIVALMLVGILVARPTGLFHGEGEE